MKKVISVEVESVAMDLGEAVASAIKAVKVAKAAGGGIPAEAIAGITAMISVAAEVGQVGADYADSKEEFLKGFNIAAYDIFDAIVG